jgi:hypothetical protein
MTLLLNLQVKDQDFPQAILMTIIQNLAIQKSDDKMI